MDHYLKALALDKNQHNQRGIAVNFINLSDSYEKLDMLDSATFYATQAHREGVRQKDAALIGFALNNLGNVYAKRGQDALAMDHYQRSLPYYQQEQDEEGVCDVYLGMAKLHREAEHLDSAFHYAKRSLAIAQSAGFVSSVMEASGFLTSYYAAVGQIDSAFAYQSATIAAKDSLFSQEKQREIQNLSYEETVRQQQILEAGEEARTQMKFNLLGGGLLALVGLVLLQYRNSRQKQKDYALVQHQKREKEKALEQLKDTQAQLVHKEKRDVAGRTYRQYRA